jgi:hypothetical protein
MMQPPVSHVPGTSWKICTELWRDVQRVASFHNTLCSLVRFLNQVYNIYQQREMKGMEIMLRML